MVASERRVFSSNALDHPTVEYTTLRMSQIPLWPILLDMSPSQRAAARQGKGVSVDSVMTTGLSRHWVQ